ncbi:MAG: ATP-grasp fold amidoligase family protein [Pseudomonadota bacterium]
MASLIFRAVDLWAYCRHPMLTVRFYRALGYLPSVGLPDTYNEKILWRKIFDRNPLIGSLSDKLRARQHVLETCPEIKAAEVLWSGSRAEDIPAQVLQDNVVVKTNHGSGFNLFVQKEKLDRPSLNRKVNGWLRHYPYGRKSGEWGYRAVRPRVYVERMLCTEAQAEPIQMNFSTFAGQPVMALVMTGAVHGPRQAGIFAADGQRFIGTPHHFLRKDQQLPQDFELPKCFHKAAACAARLGQKLDYARIDFLALEDELFASEITFYTLGGYATYTDPETERLLSRAWDLRRSWFMTAPGNGWRKAYARHLDAGLSSMPGQ